MKKFIAIEGCDGCGKATQTQLLHKYLSECGHQCDMHSFPVYADSSSALVKYYLSGSIYKSTDEVNPYGASIYYSADRHIYFTTKGISRTGEGYHLFDRYTGSNAIHQMTHLPREDWNKFLIWLSDLEVDKLKIPEPDITIYLHLDAEVADKLMSDRYNGDNDKKDLHEADIEYLKKCREAGRYVAEAWNWVVIDCTDYKNGTIRSVDEIHAEIKDIVENI